MSQVNYINHHKNVHAKMMELDLTAIDVAVYNALFLIWNASGFRETISVNREEVMTLSKVGSRNTYTKSLKRLDELKLIKYQPSFNPLIGSKINLLRFDKGTDKGSDKGISKGYDKGSEPLHKHNKLIKLFKQYKLFKQRFSKLKFDNFISFVLENIKTDEDLDRLVENFNKPDLPTEPKDLYPKDLDKLQEEVEKDLFGNPEKEESEGKPKTAYEKMLDKNIELGRELMKDKMWIEKFCMNHRILAHPTNYAFRLVLFKFTDDISMRDTTHPNLKEFKIHFNNWVKSKTYAELSHIWQKHMKKPKVVKDDAWIREFMGG